MKKFLLFAVFGLFVAKVYADYREIPHGPQNNLATADYGGVDVATTSQLTVNMSTVCVAPCSGVFYGVMFSSGIYNSIDFVDVFDTDFASQAVTTPNAYRIARLYNVNGSSSAYIVSGFQGPPKPIRFKKGLFYQASTAAYNLISALFTKFLY